MKISAKAFLFDLNGTMINDMQHHIVAWHTILTGLGANLTLEKMKEECYGKNSELLERIFPGRFTPGEMDKMSFEKEAAYQKAFLPHLKLIDGLDEFLAEAKTQNIKMAIGSAAILFNINFALDNLQLRHYFDALVSADDVVNSKPDPETYLSCAAQLNIAPEDCIVFEDMPKGVESAERAGMRCVVIKGLHEPEEFAQFKNVIAIIDAYHELI